MNAADVIPFQLALAAVGAVGAVLALASALLLKRRALPFPRKRPFISLHRYAAWTSLGIYSSLAATCLTFHFPFDDPSQIFDMGVFVVHPLLGPVGAVLYLGKIIAVRRLKAGWKLPGLLWGTALFVFWAVQFGTVLPSY